ncbi:MAG TPA: LacI family DNA-binding transcriptional regulator [Verrucomicrobiae bacterium]|nr:LacI family DNA-binding transcriptional regulator [Verrucomicrobiae bacterium]
MAPSPSNARVTLSDIARQLNVSHTTVSRALRDDRQISKSLRQQVQRTAQEMGYRPDAMLSALAHYRRSNTASRITAEIAWINHWPDPKKLRRVGDYDLFWQGAAAEADRNGYRLEEFPLDEKMPPERLERILLARNVPGILIPPWWHGKYPDWGDFHWERFCVVCFGHTIHAPRVHLASSDQFFDSVLAYESIRKNGYQRIGMVTNATVGTRLRFLAGYLFAQSQDLASLRLPPLLFPVSSSQENQPKLVAWLKRTKPDAIFTDQAALRDMLVNAGYRVPQDIGLARTSVMAGGSDAGIYQNSNEIGRVAIQLLISLIHHNERGVPRLRRELMVEGEWADGSTLPPRHISP